MNITKFVSDRLKEFEDHTLMWGSQEAIELQAIQLIEIEFMLSHEDMYDKNNRVVFDAYNATLRENYPTFGNMPLHIMEVEANFPTALINITNIVREKLKKL